MEKRNKMANNAGSNVPRNDTSSPATTSSSRAHEVAGLKVAIAELRKQINNLPRPSRVPFRNGTNCGQRLHTPCSSRPSNNGATNADPELCWYLRKYGSNARTCREPCLYFNQ